VLSGVALGVVEIRIGGDSTDTPGTYLSS
jgi:hypothetical protein